jgi:hypothetical protein
MNQRDAHVLNAAIINESDNSDGLQPLTSDEMETVKPTMQNYGPALAAISFNYTGLDGRENINE